MRQWLESWLNGREQRVCIDGTSSDWLRVLSGVPQGSVLGPILFLVYINDIDLVVENDILKFADDTKLYGIVSDQAQAESMQNDLNGVAVISGSAQ